MGSSTKYGEPDRRAAALAWIITGSTERAAAHCGVAARTIRDWTKTDWWPEYVQDARDAHQDELDAKYTDIIDKAVSAIADRVEHGDHVLTKDGTLTRKPVGARDLVITVGTIQDKRALIRREPTSIRAGDSTLDKLSDQFRKLLDQHNGSKDKVVDGGVGDTAHQPSPGKQGAGTTTQH